MDEAPNGVIFFSTGTHLKSTQMSKSTLDAFLETSSKLKQKIIWKSENYTLPGLSKNVKLAKYLPQIDILSKFSREIKKTLLNKVIFMDVI
jgi:glucuronosyltransferase